MRRVEAQHQQVVEDRTLRREDDHQRVERRVLGQPPDEARLVQQPAVHHDFEAHLSPADHQHFEEVRHFLEVRDEVPGEEQRDALDRGRQHALGQLGDELAQQFVVDVVLGHLVSRPYLLEEDHEDVADVVREHFDLLGVQQPVQQLVYLRTVLPLLDLRVVVEQVRLDAHRALDHRVRVLGDAQNVGDHFERLEHQLDDFRGVTAGLPQRQNVHFEQRREEVDSSFFFREAQHVPRDELVAGELTDSEGHVRDEDRQEDCARGAVIHDLHEDIEDALMSGDYPCDDCIVLVLVEENQEVARQPPRSLGHERGSHFVQTDDGRQDDVRGQLVGLGGQVDDLFERGAQVDVDQLRQAGLPSGLVSLARSCCPPASCSARPSGGSGRASTTGSSRTAGTP